MGLHDTGASFFVIVSLVLEDVGDRALTLSPLDAMFGTLQMMAARCTRAYLAAESVSLGVAGLTRYLALTMASVEAVTAVVAQVLGHASRLPRSSNT